MRLSPKMMFRKYEYALDLLRERPAINNKDLHAAIKKQFGHGMSAEKMREARVQVKKEAAGKKAVIGMERAGRASRLKESSPNLLRELTGELVTDQNIGDITNIVMKRLPGLKFFHIDVDDAGRIQVKYIVRTEQTGTLKI